MIEACELTMRYGFTVALDHVSFKAKPGEILGLLGPNGAGKTTLMRILSTFLTPLCGTATVDGFNILQKPLEVRRLMGYLPETAPLYLGMQVDEYLKFIAQARHLQAKMARQRLTWVIENLSLKEVLKKTISELSKGYRQRVGLAQALMHDPKVLILDEPTAGLDPFQIIEIRELIRKLAQEKTILFSTHIMQEADSLSHRILIIHEGKKIADGTLEELQATAMGQDCYHLTVRASREEVENALRGLSALGSFSFLETGRGDLLSTFELRGPFGPELWNEADQMIKEKNWALQSFGPHRLSLEETFLGLTRSLRFKEKEKKEGEK
ncbi:MAG: ATP-binding cassette domain-containing protein [Chlamydiae bacterium]|nr:ATP-binding cassette domain-containing protein [Chlamydiota bacterium]MBI3267238.1 ATP-binding cassette domain-containing protein [Chlamydiota bacterium]